MRSAFKIQTKMLFYLLFINKHGHIESLCDILVVYVKAIIVQ